MDIKGLKNSIIKEDVKGTVDWDLPWEKLKDSTILITGASGMIPSYVMYTLLGLNDERAMGIKILALVRNEEKARRIFKEVLDREDVELIVQDVSMPLKYDGPVDYIIHGGSQAKPREHSQAPTATIRANLMGTFNLLDLAVEKGSRGFVLMSSSEVYGQALSEVCTIKEDSYGYIDCLNPRSCYSEGKRAAETICASFASQYGINCKIPRFAHIYGPGMGLNDGRVQADFAANVFRGEDIVMNSDGSAIRSYTYVADAVSGLFHILLKGEDMAYNVADSDNSISIRNLAEAFAASRPEKGIKVVVNIDESRKASYNPAQFIALDNSKLKALGWAPRMSIAEGVGRMVSHLEITEG